MKKYILETLLQEAVKISRQGEVKDMPLVDLVKQELEHKYEFDAITSAEADALFELRRMENETPVYHDVDVVKVIEDLIEMAKTWGEGSGGSTQAVAQHPFIQNAEAAIGMINAFKQKKT